MALPLLQIAPINTYLSLLDVQNILFEYSVDNAATFSVNIAAFQMATLYFVKVNALKSISWKKGRKC